MEVLTSQKSGITRFIKVFVSFALIALIFYKINFTEWLSIIRSANISGLSVAFLLVVFSIVISALKWQILLNCLNVKVPIQKLTVSYFVGLFFNNFLPTNIGGDVVRIYDVGKYTGKKTEAAASVIVERILAGFALGLTALIAVFISFDRSKSFLWLIISFLLLCVIFLLLAMNRSILHYLNDKLLPGLFNIKERARDVAEAIHKCSINKNLVARVLIWSLVFQLVVVLVNYLIFLSLGVRVSLVYCLIFIPLISALSLLPISVNGLGVREGAYIFFFSKVGLNSAQSVSASLVFFVLVVLTSLIGGIAFAWQR
jgi:uncharacterized protein (TIRG00374 family)